MTTGIIFNIQKYSIHDGPGIRTTVFLKGCPLRCLWCHNPESLSPERQLLIFQDRCMGCGECIKVCPVEAISVKDGVMVTDRSKCTNCGECAEACFTLAREMAGKIMDVPQLMKEIEKDAVFYEESGGGVTFSGGEPLMQPVFLKELLEGCKLKGIHTAVDTSGYARAEIIQRISAHTDLFLYDLKMMDDEKHKKYVGVSNKIILDNLVALTKQSKRIFIRIPIVPGINDDMENIEASGRFLSSLQGIEQIDILPYHNIAQEKYRRMNQGYCLADVKALSAEKINEISEKLKSYGFKIKIGG